jgi:hypothetical protein
MDHKLEQLNPELTLKLKTANGRDSKAGDDSLSTLRTFVNSGRVPRSAVLLAWNEADKSWYAWEAE